MKLATFVPTGESVARFGVALDDHTEIGRAHV